MRLKCIVVCLLFSITNLHAREISLDRLANLAQIRYSSAAADEVRALAVLLNQIQHQSDTQKLTRINDFFNQRLKFSNDLDIWDQSDYWATPLESMGRGLADCEDFSIAKYVFLRTLNISEDKLKLTYVRATLGSDGDKFVVAHMVLSYYATPQAEPLVLDNLIPQILPASQRSDLLPIFSFNGTSLWVAGNSQPKAESTKHLSKWRDLLNRVAADGLQ